MAKSRGISADMQSPRTRLLYLIYSAPNSRIKAAPGTKSNIAALGYKSDGHFHYDWNYLLDASMIEEKTATTKSPIQAKKSSRSTRPQSMSNWIMVIMGIAMVSFTVGL